MKKIALLIVLSAFVNALLAQDLERSVGCAHVKNRLHEKVTVGDAAEENYDIKYVKLNIKMTNVSTAIIGNAITKAVVVVPTLSQYKFELIAANTVDSVLINGVNSPFTSAGDVRTVTLPLALSMGTMFTAQVFYHGTPPSGTLYSSLGINALQSPSWGTFATFTLSESYHAKEWWPCKQSLNDKIDSSDIWITVADSLKAGSNGVLQNITTIDSAHKRYEWKERHPINYYLISAAVAPYVDYSYYMHYTGSTDSTLVQNYVYNNPGTLPYFKNVIDSTGMMIDYFSTIYGRYPFWNEKYGHCMGAFSGGMEHQTMTTAGFFEGTLVAHELAHQWFGDNSTCATWSDIFMNEGFASYSEYLFIDHFRGHAGALTQIQSQHSNVLSYDTGTVYCVDTTSEGRIFDSRLSYDKGASMLHMLRFVVNNDSLFFAVYRAYQQQYKDSTGTILNFKNVLENMLGTTVNSINIDTFFNQWCFLQGYPKYTIRWNQVGSDVVIKMAQIGAIPASVSLFKLPFEIKLYSTAGDTIVRGVNVVDTQVFHFNWSHAMLSLSFDPNYWLLYKLNTGIIHDLTLSAATEAQPALNIYPNPAPDCWHVENVPENSILELIDLSGRVIWTSSNSTQSLLNIPAGKLSRGLYLLKITNKDFGVVNYKLLKD